MELFKSLKDKTKLYEIDLNTWYDLINERVSEYLKIYISKMYLGQKYIIMDIW